MVADCWIRKCGDFWGFWLALTWVATEEVGEEVGFSSNMFHDYGVRPELFDHALDAHVLDIGECHIPVCTEILRISINFYQAAVSEEEVEFRDCMKKG